MEDMVGGAGKDLSECEGEFKAGDVAIAFDGVDALAGDADGVGELLLGQAASGAKLFNSICDCGRHVKRTFQIRVARTEVDVKPAFHFVGETGDFWG